MGETGSGSKLNTSFREVAVNMIKMLLPFISHIYQCLIDEMTFTVVKTDKPCHKRN